MPDCRGGARCWSPGPVNPRRALGAGAGSGLGSVPRGLSTARALGTAPGAGEEEQGSGARRSEGSRGPSWLCCSTARSCGAAATAGKEGGSAQKRRFSAAPCPYMGSGAACAGPEPGTRTRGAGGKGQRNPLHSQVPARGASPHLNPAHKEHGHVPGVPLPSIPRNLKPRRPWAMEGDKCREPSPLPAPAVAGSEHRVHIALAQSCLSPRHCM